jgi:mevalonate kinase
MTHADASQRSPIIVPTELRELLSKLIDEKKCGAIFSAPGTFFFAGEKATARRAVIKGKKAIHGAYATCMKIPRRVYVGLEPCGTDDLRIQFGSSDISLWNPKDDTKSAVRWGGRHGILAYPLRAAALAFEAQLGRPVRTGYKLHVLTDFAGDFGLGWSGAFSAALAACLLHSEGELHSLDFYDTEEWGAATKFEGALDKIMRLAWCIESVIHGGRSSGSAIAGALLPTGLPFAYRANFPKELWPKEVMPPPPLKSAAFAPFFDPKTASYEFFLLPSRTIALSHAELTREENQIADALFTTKGIFLIHTNFGKSTADAARFEHSKLNPIGFDEDDGDYNHLVNICEKMKETMEAVLANPEESDTKWQLLCDLTIRLQGFLAFMGFNFAVGDEILGRVLSEFQHTAPAMASRHAGGKFTGGGRGGSLLIIAGARFNELLNVIVPVVEDIRKLHDARNPRLGPSTISVIYSAHKDGIETRGLVRV